ncbi:MAG: hypothetical protein P8R42_05400 [Candidatus Binatia bacterium]|nr:hypothetical protein [Candidatus Binatia bacterium]
MLNVVRLDKYYSPWEVERAIGHFVEHYNHRRFHESLDKGTENRHAELDAVLLRARVDLIPAGSRLRAKRGMGRCDEGRS